MSCDILSDIVSPMIVEFSLFHLLVVQAPLVLVHCIVVIISATCDMIREVAMLVSDSDLLLQTHLFVVKLAEAILQHLGFNLLLLKLKLFLELAGAFKPCSLVQVLGAFQVAEVDITKTEVVADDLFLSHALWRSKNAKVIEDPILGTSLTVVESWIDDVVYLGASAG